MILQRLTLKEFRSYSKKIIEFSAGTTLIIGRNTAGKTNIIEAIWMLALGKSFRAGQDREVISWGSELGVIHGDVMGDGDVTSLDFYVTHGIVQGQKAPMKKYMVNGISRRLGDFLGNIRVVLFWPEHLELITDSPSIRRHYLDSVLVQVDSEYRRNLLSYEKGLRQRNSLLGAIQEGKASRSQLLFWDQLLIKSGGYLTEKRMELLQYINNFQLPISNFHISYDKSVISPSRLEQYKTEEVAAGITLVGPHRDDFIVKKLQHPNAKIQKDMSYVELSKYGSRGEQRLGVLWMKLAELSFIQGRIGERPILLLDDIFSELDEDHKQLVMDIVGKQQTIITSAEADILDLFPKQAISVIHL